MALHVRNLKICSKFILKSSFMILVLLGSFFTKESTKVHEV